MTLLVSIWGASENLSLLGREYQMVFSPDVRAMQWIRQNTSPDSRFFVDGFAIYGDTSVVGADAGWWIPLLAGRENTMPPQYALFNEAEITPGYRSNIISLILDMQQASLASERGVALLRAHDITHVYLGQAQGKVNNPLPLINPQDLAQSHAFDLVYRQDRVWIFALANTDE